MKSIFMIAALYGSLVNGYLQKAPDISTVDGIARNTSSLTESQANSLNYKLVVDEKPQVGTNQYAVATGWVEDDRIHRVYEIYNNPPAPPRQWYRYDISAACEEFNVLDDMMNYVNSNPKVKWFYDSSNSIKENNEYFISVTNSLIQSGMDEKKINEILDRAYQINQMGESK